MRHDGCYDPVRRDGQDQHVHGHLLRSGSEKKRAVLDAGAYGAKIVGSGGGGCIVALTDQNNTNALVESFKNAGAVDAFVVVQSSGSETKKIF